MRMQLLHGSRAVLSQHACCILCFWRNCVDTMLPARYNPQLVPDAIVLTTARH
jgi:hypothetical protein